MQLQEMRYAVAVMEHRSFTKAADALFVSQPALSQSIGRLEHQRSESSLSDTSRYSVCGRSQAHFADG